MLDSNPAVMQPVYLIISPWISGINMIVNGDCYYVAVSCGECISPDLHECAVPTQEHTFPQITDALYCTDSEIFRRSSPIN